MFATLQRVCAIALFLISSLIATNASAEISWKNSPEQVFQSARVSGKPILVFVTAEWCHYCQKMKRETWSDEKLSMAISGNFETLVLDGDKDKEIVSQMDLRGYPATLIYNPDGDFVAQKGGFMPPEVAAKWLAKSIRR